eukprot:2239300-Pyramimonas_sp.AAC.1
MSCKLIRPCTQAAPSRLRDRMRRLASSRGCPKTATMTFIALSTTYDQYNVGHCLRRGQLAAHDVLLQAEARWRERYAHEAQ